TRAGRVGPLGPGRAAIDRVRPGLGATAWPGPHVGADAEEPWVGRRAGGVGRPARGRRREPGALSRRRAPAPPESAYPVSGVNFLSLFLEEARELLQALESGLMDLESRQGDRAHLDRTFRAAHTLKGGAGMVGLPTIAEFTHGVEAVLDAIRSGQLAVTG